MTLTGKSEVLGEKLVQVSLCPLQIPIVHFPACSYISHLPQDLFMTTCCMQWSHSEADIRSTTQQVPQLLQNSGRSLEFSQKPDTDVYSKPHTSMPHSHNQQDATTFSFINLFKSAQHVSGNKLAHPQEHFFNCIDSFWYNAPPLLPIGATVETEWSSVSTVVPIGSSVGASYQKLYIQLKKCS